LLLERLPLAHVTAVEDDAPDVLVVPQIRVLHLELQAGSVEMLKRTLEGVAVGTAGPVAGDQLPEPRSIALAQNPVEPASLDIDGAVAEHALDRRALVGHDAVGVEDGDQVTRMGDERAEPSLALATVQIRRERGAVEGQRDLCAERLK